MDPVTQGAVGAAATLSIAGRANLAKGALIGALAAMAPDLDVLIRSNHDPLLAIEYHRHFTHSLFFVPFGALICSLVAYLFTAKLWGLSFKRLYFWCFVGYGTHALIDAFTSYGTQLFWPFSGFRVAWDIIAVVDIFFTLPLLLAIYLTIRRANFKFIAAGFVWCASYLLGGSFQHSAALAAGHQLAAAREHPVSRITVKPSFSNLAVWKVIYESEGVYYVDAVRPWGDKTLVWEGSSIARYSDTHFEWLDSDSQQAKDIDRFAWFSDHFVAVSDDRDNTLVDIRYSMIPNEIRPLWGITLNPVAASDEHVVYYTERQDPWQAIKVLAAMVAGGGQAVELAKL